MGITALGNTVLQLTCRDDYLGWTTAGLTAHIDRNTVSDSEVLTSLRERVLADIFAVYADDFPAYTHLLPDVPDSLLDQLLLIEQRAGTARDISLSGQQTDDDTDVDLHNDHETEGSLETTAKSPLYTAKRARTLRELLRAHRALSRATSISGLLIDAEGTWAVNQALRQLKKWHSATAMMEITVCGGVPPYTHLLAGKLACLLMLTPTVREDYTSKYGGEQSVIASRMAGRPIIKMPELVFLCTSSLYTQNSSQYNRVVLGSGPAMSPKTAMRYINLGVSRGFGSPNLGTETEDALADLATTARTFKKVNFVFGEGQSPKLRQLREGFSALGLESTNVLNHGSQRIVYGVNLADNTIRYLLGVDSSPRYILDAGSTDDVAEFWRQRWLASRINYDPALDALSKSTPLAERVSRLIPTRALPIEESMNPSTPSGPTEEHSIAMQFTEDERIVFIRHLYREESGYSDHVKIGRLRELNIRTRLEDVVRRIIRSGGSVIITGNAGDGKTHTLRLLEADLIAANASVIPDASELTQEQVFDLWDAARGEGRPFCIAVNEGPLIELIRGGRMTRQWLNEVRDKLVHLVHYLPIDQTPTTSDTKFELVPGDTYIIDLSLRQTLARDMSALIVSKLTEDRWYEGCQSCLAEPRCPVQYNRKILKTPAVVERIQSLLQRVAERGIRATFREVLAYVSYLIFGGKTCAELNLDPDAEHNKYYWHAFEGQGILFEQLHRGLDPLMQTSPKIDEALWKGSINPSDFVGAERSPPFTRDLDVTSEREPNSKDDLFAALKRRWYFEHKEGHLTHTTQADKLFMELQNSNSSPQLRVGRLLGLINEWWNKADKDLQDQLRLWTRLSYSPRAKGRAMVSGRHVSNLSLGLLAPSLAPHLRAAFGDQPVDHVLLAPPANVRFANLLIDRRLLETLVSKAMTESSADLERRLIKFNDTLSQHAEVAGHIRNIEILDPQLDLSVRLRVDLNQRRYDSAQ